MSATSSSRPQHDDQDAPPRAATRTLQERFKIRLVTLRLQPEDRLGDERR